MGKKSKKQDLDATAEELDQTTENADTATEETYEEKLQYASPMAHPLATRKLAKRLYKLMKKGRKSKSLRKGVKELKKFIRKGEKGIVVLAADTDPIDIVSHFPVLCEENGIPYCWTPSKRDLGAIMQARPCCAVLVKTREDYEESFNECISTVKGLPMPL